MRARWLVVGVLGAGLLLSDCSQQPPDPATPSARPVGEVAKEFDVPGCPATDPGANAVPNGLPVTSLPCLTTGETVNLAGLPRRPMVVNVWAQWCGPCREESPFLREAFQDLDGVAFVGINYQDPQPDWAVEFAGRVGWRYPHVQDMDRTLQRELSIPGLPMTLFVNAEGAVVGRHAGKLESTQQLKDLVAEHLGTS